MRKIAVLLLLFVCIAQPLSAQDRLSQMISPGFHPVTFEDPRITSEIRPVFVQHEIDDKFVSQGGDVQVYALQARFKLADDWALIATKDGYVDFNPEANVPQDEGWANVEAGLKYAFYQDQQAGQIASIQLRYEFPWGDEEVFQGQGDGTIHPSLSAAFPLTDSLTMLAGSGLRIPVDSKDSTFWDVDAQVDYRIDMDGWSLHPLFGVSLIYVADAGKRLGIADEGQDFFNFGATEADGEDILTGVAGLRAKLTENIEAGASYQFPFDSSTGNRIIDYRITGDVIIRF